jgi:NAD(P)-dependent dehydrogenase (short-subunit alcohol dehydrogenase family)
MAHWTAEDIPDQTGRTVVVTGASSGLGLVTARELARHGAHVILACRNTAKADAATTGISGDLEVRALDLADLASVRAFVDGLGTIDVLVNNAGVMAVPRGRTADGFETQIGTNHLGHFALTTWLGDRVRDRVVTVSSMLHRFGGIALDDLNWERRHYRRWAAYGQSKLANLLFTYELQRRHAAGEPVPQALAAHPGYANTNLNGKTGTLLDRVTPLADAMFGQSAEMGALPTLMAATADLPGGAYVGPGGVGEQRGYPQLVGSSKASQDSDTGRGLWSLSAELVGT